MKHVKENQIAIITGASRGIGRAIALEFAKNGATVVLAARSVEQLYRVEQEIESGGGAAVAIPTDVTSVDSVHALAYRTLEEFGRIDVLVNNAGIGRVGKVEDPGFASDVLATMQASLFGMISATQAVLPAMKKQRSGAIVNMSSVMGRKAFANFGSYAIAMHGVTALSDALRQELYGTGIQITAVHPGLTATDLLSHVGASDMPPSFRYMRQLAPEQVARSVYRAARKGQSRVVLPGTANILVLGEALSPSIGDRIARELAKGRLAKLLGLSSGKTNREAVAIEAHEGRVRA